MLAGAGAGRYRTFAIGHHPFGRDNETLAGKSGHGIYDCNLASHNGMRSSMGWKADTGFVTSSYCNGFRMVLLLCRPLEDGIEQEMV